MGLQRPDRIHQDPKAATAGTGRSEVRELLAETSRDVEFDTTPVRAAISSIADETTAERPVVHPVC